MALMFFPDRAGSDREMARVAADDGTVAVAVPGALDAQPAFKPFVELAARIAGPEAMSLLTTYFVCGDLGELDGLFDAAGLQVTVSREVAAPTRRPSVDAAVTTEVESTPLVERISEATYRQLREGARGDHATVHRTGRHAGRPRSSPWWWPPPDAEPECARLEAVSNGVCVPAAGG